MQKTTKKLFFVTILLFLISIGVPAVFSFVYKLDTTKLLQILIMSLILFGVIAIEFFYQLSSDKKFVNQFGMENNCTLFVLCYFLCMLVGCINPFMDAMAWPFLMIALLLLLVSNDSMAVCSYIGVLTISCLLSETDVSIMAMFMFCGLSVIFFFKRVDERYKIGIPVFMVLCIYLVSVMANITLFSDSSMNYETFLVPGINIMINLVLMIIVLKFISARHVHKYRERYLTINDSEFEIFADLKKNNSKTYYRAIHTSYLTEKLTRKFNMNADSVKTASYYWRLCMDESGKQNKKYIDKLRDEYAFPPSAIELILELTDKSTRLKSKEAVSVYMSNLVIETISNKIAKEKEAKINYKQLIQDLFMEKQNQGFFEQCDFTMRELFEMKKSFVEESLYYDFLR